MEQEEFKAVDINRVDNGFIVRMSTVTPDTPGSPVAVQQVRTHVAKTFEEVITVLRRHFDYPLLHSERKKDSES